MNGITLNVKGAFTSTMLAGGIALMIVGGYIYKDVPKIGDRLLVVGIILIIISVIWYFARFLLGLYVDWFLSE